MSLNSEINLPFIIFSFLALIFIFLVMHLSIFLSDVIYWKRGRDIKKIVKLMFLLMCIFLLSGIFYFILYMRPVSLPL